MKKTYSNPTQWYCTKTITRNLPIPGFSALESLGFENLDLRSGSNATRFLRSLGYKFKDNDAVNGWNRQAMSEHFKGSSQVCTQFIDFFTIYSFVSIRRQGTFIRHTPFIWPNWPSKRYEPFILYPFLRQPNIIMMCHWAHLGEFQLRSSSFRDLAVAVRTRTDIKRKSQYKVKLNLITASSGTKK